MLTVEDPKRPALRFAATSAMYRTYVAEMGQNLEHAIILPPLPVEAIGRPHDATLVIEILKHVGLEDVLGPEITAAGVLRSVTEKYHPYG